MFNNITQRMQDYSNEIPSNTISSIAKSALYSFTVTAFITAMESAVSSKTIGSSSDLYTRPFVAAGIGALASLIHALTTPIFSAIFENDAQDIYPYEFIKNIVIAASIGVVIDCAKTLRINLFANAHFTVLSIHLTKSCLHLGPRLLDLFGDHARAMEIRDNLTAWGLDSLAGSNSTYFVF